MVANRYGNADQALFIWVNLPTRLSLIFEYCSFMKKFNVNFNTCVKFHVENEWEISRMCEIDV